MSDVKVEIHLIVFESPRSRLFRSDVKFVGLPNVGLTRFDCRREIKNFSLKLASRITTISFL